MCHLSRSAFVVIIAAVVLTGCNESDRASATRSTARSESKLIQRTVVDNLLDSPAVPDVAIRVDSSFSFAGSFDIEIRANADEWPDSLVGEPIAAGERFVFVDALQDQFVRRLLIVQFEGFLGNNDQTYNYNFSQADSIGGNRYRHNTWFYNSREQAAQNPTGEGAATQRFLADNGYVLEDEFMMSRFVGLASEDRRNEIIIYYIEMLRSSMGFTLAEWEGLADDDRSDDIVQGLVTRSKKAFDIVRG